MLIIFDLDDTLIDTSGLISPYRLKQAFLQMFEAGFPFPNSLEAFEMLKRIDSGSLSARDALAEFAEINGVSKNCLDGVIKEMYESRSLEMPLCAREGVLVLLEELKAHHCLAVVTAGFSELQHAKMEKAGIDSTIFSKIVVCREAQKKVCYQMLIEEMGYLPREVIVCGDRIGADLSPAKELGCNTVHMRWGRGLVSRGRKEDVDFTIAQLLELKEIVTRLNKI